MLVGALLLGACGSFGDDDDAAVSEETADTRAPHGLSLSGEGSGSDPGPRRSGTFDDSADEDGEAGRPPSDDPAAAAPVLMSAADLGRSIIYTATLDIVVDDVGAASRQAQQAIAAVGGIVFSQDTTTEPVARTTLVFKVQPGDFGEAMNRLEGIGTVVSQDISADDVTDRVVDLQSRILTAEVSVERLRRLLDGATSVEAIAALEGQLLDRETNLELLRGQLRTVQAQVSLATITVTIGEQAPPASAPEIAVTTTAYVGDDEGDRCPGERRLTADEGDDVVLCVTIENTGNVDLNDIEVRDLGLDLRREDFSLLDFGDDDVLEPGDSVVAWAVFEAETNSRPRPSVTAVPVDTDGEVIRQTMTTTEENLALEIIEDDSLPGLVDSLGVGFGVVRQIIGVAVLAVGVLAPLAILAAIPAGAYLWWRRRADEPADTAPTESPSTA